MAKKACRETTRDYIEGMKQPVPFYKQPLKPRKPLSSEEIAALPESSVLQEIAVMPSIGEVISVRSAKAHLSGLLDLVARGREIVITSDGKPKARLVPADAAPRRQPFTGTREHLKTMPPWSGGPTAEEIIREDRDARGW